MKAEYGISLQITDGQWKKASLTLEESDRLNGETPEEFLTRTASTLEGWFREKNGPPSELDLGNGKVDIQWDKPQPEQDRISVLIADINSCQEFKVLESYRLMVKGNPELEAAYEQMKLKLTVD